MAPHSSILAWRIPWTEEPGGLQYMGPKESDTTARLSTVFTTSITREAQISHIYTHIYPHLGYHRGQCLSHSYSVSSGPCFTSPAAIM